MADRSSGRTTNRAPPQPGGDGPHDAWEMAWAAASTATPEWPLVPVCMYCRRVAVRLADCQERWLEVPSTVRVTFGSFERAPHLTHGLCPECLESHYPRDARAADTGVRVGSAEPGG